MADTYIYRAAETVFMNVIDLLLFNKINISCLRRLALCN